MDTFAFSHSLSIAPVTRRTPVETLSAEVTHAGRKWLLVLIRTYDLTEGSCLLEIRNEEDNDSEAVEPCGQWHIKSDDDAPAMLSIEVELGAVEDLADDADAVLEALVAELVKVGGQWGLEVAGEVLS